MHFMNFAICIFRSVWICAACMPKLHVACMHAGEQLNNSREWHAFRGSSHRGEVENCKIASFENECGIVTLEQS